MRVSNYLAVVLAVLCIHLLLVVSVQAEKVPELPINCEAVEKALFSENLRALAATTDDEELLLGLAYLARAGDPVRQEISQRVVQLKPEYEPHVVVLAIKRDGPNETRVSRLLKCDPENALGHYLEAIQLRQANRDDDALDAFRRGAKCRELRLYEPVTGPALFKALDALHLKGRDRLCALSWIATNDSNFYPGSIQRLDNGLSEIAHLSANDRREEISDLLLILAGQVHATNFHNCWYAQRALRSAFYLKAEVAAMEDSPKMHGYAAVTQALVSTEFRWPELEDRNNAREIARLLPSRINLAFGIVDATTPQWLIKLRQGIPEEHLAEFDQATEAWIKSAETLIDVSSHDPDEIVGAYLKGMPPPRQDVRPPWISQHTYVERAVHKYPEVFKAGMAFENAMDAAHAVRNRAAPTMQNVTRMMVIGEALISYAFKHDHRLPESIDVLYEQGYLDKAKIENKSLLSGRPYVYVGANMRLPEKQRDRFQFILLYDDHEIDGNHQFVLAIPGVPTRPVEEVKQRVEAQRK